MSNYDLFRCNLWLTESLQTSLKIVHVSKVAGRCIGGEEILIFVEKVDKSRWISCHAWIMNWFCHFAFVEDIKVRFFEGHPTSTWEAFAEFTEFDVHHQYGIAFRYILG